MKLANRTEREKGIAALFFLAICYGILPLLPRYFSGSFDLFQQIYLRIFIGCIFLFIIFRKSISLKKIFSISFKRTGYIFLRSFFYYFLGVGFFTLAILTTKVSNVVFVSSVPTTAILGFLLLREHITFKKVLLVLLSACGVLVIAIKNVNGLSFGMGEIFALFSAFFTSLGFITRKWQLKSLNDYEVSMLMLLFASIQLFAVSLYKGEGLPISGWTIGIIFALLLAGILNGGASFFMNYGFARVDAVLASNILTLGVVFATVFAFVVFREFPSPQEIFGGTLIVLSAIILHQYEKRKT